MDGQTALRWASRRLVRAVAGSTSAGLGEAASVRARCIWGGSAEPVQVKDPNDSGVILCDLPEQERAEFLRRYDEAMTPRMVRPPPAAAPAPAWMEADGHRDQPSRLRRGTRVVRDGTAQTRSAEEV
jgi:hypothetical protein